jgi:hypothetical protein
VSQPANDFTQSPYSRARFRVLWDGRVVRGILRVSSLRKHFVLEDQVLDHAPVLLERYRTDDEAFEAWAREAEIALRRDRNLDGVAKVVEVQLIDGSTGARLGFVMDECVPITYAAVDQLDALSDEPAMEVLTLSHSGWRTESH